MIHYTPSGQDLFLKWRLTVLRWEGPCSKMPRFSPVLHLWGWTKGLEKAIPANPAQTASPTGTKYSNRFAYGGHSHPNHNRPSYTYNHFHLMMACCWVSPKLWLISHVTWQLVGALPSIQFSFSPAAGQELFIKWRMIVLRWEGPCPKMPRLNPVGVDHGTQTASLIAPYT